MQDRIDQFTFAGHNATVMIPENANGKWLWKTEFFRAFDEVEMALYQDGYTRVYYEISDKYGSPDAVQLMYAFYLELMQCYELNTKGILCGFSRGGLYAFNFTLNHPECVEKIYLDAPVLDLRTWPRTDPAYGELALHRQVMVEYGFSSEDAFQNSQVYPVCQLEAFFAHGIPTLLVAGDSDRVVDFGKNSQVMIDYCALHGIPLIYYVKVGGDHHPHSFGHVDPAKPETAEVQVYASHIPGTSRECPAILKNEASLLTDFFR